ncbi:hypothetical protein CKO15_09855 [Halorhodospira abdelmalekii]|uniref:hypothetical protein n=1 Tax=Halorhodospira abdelmalekii TaxID=421629 RepID=UPI001904A522|nr:hypothetical protein [Halorhodospira abdelmalekii]MBK1735582.1 hypothetical protein [Halorhodospira abdelmalekii]
MTPHQMELIHALVTECIGLTAEGEYHGFVSYSGHVDWIHAFVAPATTDYIHSENWITDLPINEHFSLEEPTGTTKLAATLSKVRALRTRTAAVA